MTTETIVAATTADDYRAFAQLIREYVVWCRARYEDQTWLVNEVFSYQCLDEEIEALPVAYGPPKGRTFLVWRDGQVGGAGAYRRLPDGTCEMKRLFVPDRFRGRGTGRRLCGALVEAARDDGFALMRLDTGTRFAEALTMYRSMGFRDCPPYYDYPARLMPHVVFLQLPLEQMPAPT